MQRAETMSRLCRTLKPVATTGNSLYLNMFSANDTENSKKDRQTNRLSITSWFDARPRFCEVK